jgi:hypothetical protein
MMTVRRARERVFELPMAADRERASERRQAPEDEQDEPGAEGGAESPAADQLPGAPADDDSPLGDTDQHSKG